MEALSVVAQGVSMTLLLTLSSFVLGAVGGIPLALARRSRFVVVRFVARSVIELLRGIPPLAWLFIIYFGIGTGVIELSSFAAAVIGFGLVASAYMAEIYRGGLTAIHEGQWEASDALGLSRAATLATIIGPQVLRVSIPAAATFAIGLLKDSSVASVIGVQDTIYWASHESTVSGDAIVPFLYAAGLYVAMTIPCAWATRWLDSKLRKRVAR
ncbi:amino acid ABC transporter permease [Paenarthrobacter sp. NPDC056912]|uniref:amino acid ABC transporter permease n=1 Tax=Paenarthrobacter sp. NPDC056912 TaxID=3345965 RepID=UPI00366AC7EF